ncbi:hypothetical protein EDD37DRAFT_668204 [Exophiala viscosa]|uniref:uncharacterized protein n=1 Tax=Exophiala viscosa TaxID=2486360 RepID=UPI00219BB39C|nr:hypothetical protein EDD37DRAFT_668204 [Exophiala viscosa]
MAPRKPASPAKPRRVTRARAANTDTDSKPALDDAPKRKAALPQAVPTTSRTKAIEAQTRITKKTDTKTSTRSVKSTPIVEVDENKEDDEITVTVARPASKATRATRTTAAPSAKPVASSLAAAPRRRVRVTPLDTTTSEPAPSKEAEAAKPEKKTSAKEKKDMTDVSKPIISRAKRGIVAATVEENNDAEKVMADEPEPKRRGRTRTTKTEATEITTEPSKTAPKGRGRPKKADTTAELTKDVPVTTRQTRARTGSSASAALPEAAVNVVVPPRKKVTFQDLPDEDDEKENKQPPALAKSKATKKGAATTAATQKSEAATKGMRAKPIRKPAATKTTKSTRNASKTAKQPEVEEPEKHMPSVLTPKKITQVAKAMPMDSEGEEEDDKSPVRNLSQSPKRPHVLPLSPIKTLDFAPALKSPEKQEGAPGIMSPPRRLPSSPIKDGLQESPRRAPEGVTVFRTQIHDPNHAALSLNPSNMNSNSHLLQSPKRGICDAITFPASALKSRNSPMKSALLSSPARRLFSASKQKSPARMSPSPQKKQATPTEEQISSPGDVDIVMSSHFRSSPSPKRAARVYTISQEEFAQEHGLGGGLDFDQSILNVRSPLKVDKVKPLMDVSADAMDVHMPEQNEADEQQDESNMETDEDNHVDDIEAASASEIDNEETVLDPALDHEDDLAGNNDVGDVDNVETPNAPPAATTEELPTTSDEASMKPPRMSGAMFRHLREVDEDSEDELAANQTPDNRLLRPQSRPSLSAANIRSRLSMGTGVVPGSASRNLGFTPLAAQVRGWRAASPEKRAVREDAVDSFSPIARLHVEGAIEVNRQSTPAREASKRKSLAGRLSFAPSTTNSPIRPDFFGEAVAAQEFEDQMDDHADATPVEEEDLHDLVQDQALEVEDDDQDEESDEDTKSTSPEREPGELTTDLIKFTNASDTAMVDFNALANEAQVLAVEKGVGEEAETFKPQVVHAGVSELPTVDEQHSVLSTSSDLYSDENAAPVERPSAASETAIMASEDVGDDDLIQPPPLVDSDTEDEVEEEHDSSIVGRQGGSVENLDGHLPTTSPATLADVRSSVEIDFNVTPVRPDLGLPRVVHTVSKVPLRPEGDVPTFSPVKMQRKRPRSMSSSNSMAAKRRSLGLSPKVMASSTEHVLLTPKGGQLSSSPQRRIRSAAPSPADSLATGTTTPGQMSFAIEDFGDSTLDGLELPDDELLSDEVNAEENTEEMNVDDSVMTIGSTLFKTPIVPTKCASMAPPSTGLSKQTATPHYAMSTRSSRRRSISTPSRALAVASTKTPATAKKTSTPHTNLKSKTPAKTSVSRTPLRSVGSGILGGAIVHYDIHTSEGSDASAFYIELLTAMGARCVKEWRWNSRASIAAEGSGEQELPVGITHVVYKDGGKRTLEKVRSAKGQVLCVGVNWVLDCYREQKWVDETSYAVDASILPRGGSRRRKSMEPRTLVNENGLLSATKHRARMSLPAGLELAGTKSAIVQTGAEGKVEVEVELEDKENLDEAEIEDKPVEEDVNDIDVSMTSAYDEEDDDQLEDSYQYETEYDYDSPAAATVGDGGETTGLRFLAGHGQGQEQDDSVMGSGLETTSMTSMTPPPLVKARGQAAAVSTPQSALLQVDYDPRTAATPVTPFLRASTTANKKSTLAKGQMSAPAKQVNRSLFEQDEQSESVGAGAGPAAGGRKAKFQIKNKMTGKADARRRTLGATLKDVETHKPVVGSPLRRA